ncbi:MAG: nucleoid-associated protein [Rhodoferax sp.]|uniref:nucleoid-associated protein n=1 Tax=Rhodoferax sp. TaxID=50421 RepID=UPI0032657638
MQIREATVHQLIKAAQTIGDENVVLHVRPEPLPIDDVLQNLCVELLSLYATSVNSNGTLGQDPVLHTFPVALTSYTSGQSGFQAFTVASLGLIKEEMKNAIFANGGYALFLRYEHDNIDFILIAMLKLKAGAGIDEETLSLQPTLNIDLKLLHEAARINLTRLANREQPYLTFIKGKAKKGDITSYFRNALACITFTDSKHHTDQLIKAAQAFVEAREDLVTPEQKLEERILMRKRLVECLDANPVQVVLATAAAAIMPTAPDDFLDFLQIGPAADQYHIDHSFQPHKATYRRLHRFTAKIGQTISVAFDVDDVQAHRISYDADRNAIVLMNPPDSLKHLIIENGSAD